MKALLIVIPALVLAGCAGSNRPASVRGGECRVFTAPEYEVRGVTQYDRRWIGTNVEAGVASCGWRRPKARPAKNLGNGRSVQVKAPAKKSWWRR